ncbi:MAG TPA: response regulator [Rhodocyclaceae bacterium]
MTTTAATSEHAILVLDDEPNIVNAIRRELSSAALGRYHCVVEGFTDPHEALARAREKTFEVVLTDYRMPEMDGVEFLKALHEIQPDCVRVVLSGQTDMDGLVKMINQTHIYRFIPKPWSSYFLKSTVAQAIGFRQTQIENRHMAAALRQRGIDLPEDAINEVDHILVVDSDISSARAVARDLTNHTRLDDVFSAMRTELVHLRAPKLDPKSITVQVTDSPVYGLKVADDLTFSCVIADFHMREMDGAKFLEAFADKQPESVRILLSADANLDSVVIALDMAHIHNFIAKPWVDYELRAAVAQALAKRRLALENAILAKMCKARDIDYTQD